MWVLKTRYLTPSNDGLEWQNNNVNEMSNTVEGTQKLQLCTICTKTWEMTGFLSKMNFSSLKNLLSQLSENPSSKAVTLFSNPLQYF
jgi:hypothetical protein